MINLLLYTYEMNKPSNLLNGALADVSPSCCENRML